MCLTSDFREELQYSHNHNHYSLPSIQHNNGQSGHNQNIMQHNFMKMLQILIGKTKSMLLTALSKDKCFHKPIHYSAAENTLFKDKTMGNHVSCRVRKNRYRRFRRYQKPDRFEFSLISVNNWPIRNHNRPKQVAKVKCRGRALSWKLELING